MSGRERSDTVLVLGAGFTKAFLPTSPLLTDFYNTQVLLERFKEFPHAWKVLSREVERGADRINLERLMTRLDGLMPYDYEDGATAELQLLLQHVKGEFQRRLTAAKQDARPHNSVAESLARVCVEKGIDCITFNYDDVFDEYLWKVLPALSILSDPYWHPDGGYGFFCKPASTCIRDSVLTMDRSSMSLLKLHGSVNWRITRGSSTPVGVSSVVHYEDWFDDPGREADDWNQIPKHLEAEPFIVPPVLTKSSLVREPILRLVWRLAFNVLAGAKRIIFVGYSFPVTDMAASFLFTEGPSFPSSDAIQVVNFAEGDHSKQSLIASYTTVFPGIREEQFDFRGAVPWCEEFTKEIDSRV